MYAYSLLQQQQVSFSFPYTPVLFLELDRLRVKPAFRAAATTELTHPITDVGTSLSFNGAMVGRGRLAGGQHALWGCGRSCGCGVVEVVEGVN